MGKRMQVIKIIQTGLTEIISGANKIRDILDDIDDLNVKDKMIEFVYLYSCLNAKLCLYILKKIPEYWEKDKVDKEFEDIIKPLKKEFKDE